MLRRSLYYTLKPFIPWGIRIRLRRIVAKRQLAESQGVWPIDPAAATAPEGWPGWPDSNQFAFVLTHDVESAVGLAKCRRLAELEKERGFRSTFNFIPEGPYRVEPELRNWLTQNGFEVGVHDLRHDGWLFQSRSKFNQHAQRINQYLGMWGAQGFRAGFMLRNLHWLQQLDVQYDSSTFDTDPFEIQSDGAGTIFPFWVPAKSNGTTSPFPASAFSRGGYVELPYSLPQDSTLFLLLQEKSPRIWLRKLNWVAQNGGMALVNVHPDYLQFPGEKPSARTFPVSHYLDLLDYSRQHFAGAFWQPTAGQLAHYARPWVIANAPTQESSLAPALPDQLKTSTPGPNLHGKRAAVLLYSYYPADPRPRRAAEALAECGMVVDLICLRESPAEPARETINGVNIRRIRVGKSRGGKLTYLWEYSRFISACFTLLAARALKHRYDVVHVHNMPDILVFGALPACLRGAKVILDLHDPMPELLTSIYDLKPDNWMVSLLKRMEQASIAFSDLVLTPNITFRDLFISRGCPAKKIEIVMNSPQPEIFDPDRFGEDDNSRDNLVFRIMHHGSIVHRHGVDHLVKAVALARRQIPNIRLDIYGSATPFLDVVMDLAASLGIGEQVAYHGPQPQTAIAEAIRQCHLGVVPNRHSPFTEINFPTRLFEYLAMHRPVLSPSTQGIRDYFDAGNLFYFKPGDPADMAEKIVAIYHNYSRVMETVANGRAVYRQHLWAGEKRRFQERLVQLLVVSPAAPQAVEVS